MRDKKEIKRIRVRVLMAQGIIMMMLVYLGPLSRSVYAQQGGATITGRVTDENGAKVAGASVRLRARSVIALFGRTNEDGVCVFEGLGAGDYVLEVIAEGFATQTSNRLRVTQGQTVTVDLKLSVAAVNELVLVVASGTPQRIDEVSKAVTVLQDQEIEARRELTLAEALRGTPGLRVQQQDPAPARPAHAGHGPAPRRAARARCLGHQRLSRAAHL